MDEMKIWGIKHKFEADFRTVMEKGMLELCLAMTSMEKAGGNVLDCRELIDIAVKVAQEKFSSSNLYPEG